MAQPAHLVAAVTGEGLLALGVRQVQRHLEVDVGRQQLQQFLQLACSTGQVL